MNGKPLIQYQPLQRVVIKQVLNSIQPCLQFYSLRHYINHTLGLYGRLDQDRWFSTTVTNINPTAKQSKVLNPYVRSLFNSYLYADIDASVNTLV